jgi:hypothetical protein
MCPSVVRAVAADDVNRKSIGRAHEVTSDEMKQNYLVTRHLSLAALFVTILSTMSLVKRALTPPTLF